MIWLQFGRNGGGLPRPLFTSLMSETVRHWLAGYSGELEVASGKFRGAKMRRRKKDKGESLPLFEERGTAISFVIIIDGFKSEQAIKNKRLSRSGGGEFLTRTLERHFTARWNCNKVVVFNLSITIESDDSTTLGGSRRELSTIPPNFIQTIHNRLAWYKFL